MLSKMHCVFDEKLPSGEREKRHTKRQRGNGLQTRRRHEGESWRQGSGEEVAEESREQVLLT